MKTSSRKIIKTFGQFLLLLYFQQPKVWFLTISWSPTPVKFCSVNYCGGGPQAYRWGIKNCFTDWLCHLVFSKSETVRPSDRPTVRPTKKSPSHFSQFELSCRGGTPNGTLLTISAMMTLSVLYGPSLAMAPPILLPMCRAYAPAIRLFTSRTNHFTPSSVLPMLDLGPSVTTTFGTYFASCSARPTPIARCN